jgi:hypothetical protein
LAPNIVSRSANSHRRSLLTGTDLGRYRAFPVDIPKSDRSFISGPEVIHTSDHLYMISKSCTLSKYVTPSNMNYVPCLWEGLRILLWSNMQSVYKSHVRSLLVYDLQLSMSKRCSRNIASGQDFVWKHNIYRNMITLTEKGNFVASLMFNKTLCISVVIYMSRISHFPSLPKPIFYTITLCGNQLNGILENSILYQS